MKLLFYIESLRSGGKERRLVELIKGLSHKTDLKIGLVLIKDDIHYKDILETNIEIFYTPRKFLKKDPSVFYKFYKIVRLFKPDIIHAWGNMVAFYAIPVKLLFRIPLVNSQITDAPSKVSNSLLGHRYTFPFSDLIISNTLAGLDAYNAPKKKSIVIYNGFDFSRIDDLSDKIEIRNKFNIRTKLVVAMVASFSDKKDYTTYVMAANKVLEKHQDVTFLCIGSGDDSRIKSLVNSKNSSKILFLGKQNNVESIMNINDIGVLIPNSDNHGEGISNALLEFMALGIPVITTSCGGNSELVENEISGYLIPPKSPEELSEKLLDLINDETTRLRFGKEGRKIVENKFQIKKMVISYLNIYEEIKST